MLHKLYTHYRPTKVLIMINIKLINLINPPNPLLSNINLASYPIYILV